MTPNHPFFSIARLVLETTTPLSIATGRTDGLSDNLLVRDANGLPAIPGSSLAGVLRHTYQSLYDPEKADDNAKNTQELFGTDKKDKTTDKSDKTNNQETGYPSFVQVSWGCLHDSHDKPIEDLLDTDDKRWADEIVTDALQTTPIRRDHVKLNHRGVSDAQKQGKFDRVSLTTGHRFSVELSLWSDKSNDSRWGKLLHLLERPEFRLGGGTRRGLGKLKVVRCYTGQFNLKEQLTQFSELTQYLSDTTHLTRLELETLSSQITLNLTPLEGYRFGGGLTQLVEDSQAQLLIVTEPCVKWQRFFTQKGDKWKGKLTQKRVVIPASSVKGALSHRVAYHYNRLTQVFAEEKLNDRDTAYQDVKRCVGENNLAVKALFGYVQEKPDKNDKDIAQIGCLIFDDVYLTGTINYLQKAEKAGVTEYIHNGVDRFTGGVREGVLFSEEVIVDEQSFQLNITVIPPSTQNDVWKALTEPEKTHIWAALKWALTDLAEGRLALGAGGGRGHGYFEDEKWQAGKNCQLPPQPFPKETIEIRDNVNTQSSIQPERKQVITDRPPDKKKPPKSEPPKKSRKQKKSKKG